jgi:hypothetical protein
MNIGRGERRAGFLAGAAFLRGAAFLMLLSAAVPNRAVLQAQTHVLIVSGLGGDAKYK